MELALSQKKSLYPSRTMSQQIGADKRGNMLPTGIPGGEKNAIGFLGPNYNYADELILPGEVGVRRGGSFGDVMGAIGGVNYYIDTIAFGQSSNRMTAGLPFTRYGINYFIKTGAKCSNGADAWDYVELIPKGDALGKNFQKGMKSVGFDVELRGLAPGIIEDTKAGLNPAPIMKALFGTGYAQCKKITRRVGDERGRIASAEGEPWTDDPTTIEWRGGLPYQTKWVKDKDVDAATWEAEVKTMNPDGTPIQETLEGFLDYPLPTLMKILAIAVAANFAAYSYRYAR